MPRRVTVRGIIIKDKKLFCQRLKERDGTERDFWCIPGGGLEAGESIHEGLKREMIEETGVTPEIGKLLFIQQYSETDREFLEFFFHITNATDYETADLANTTHGHIEVAEHGFIDPANTILLPEFLQKMDISKYIDSNDPVEIFSYLSPADE